MAEWWRWQVIEVVVIGGGERAATVQGGVLPGPELELVG